MLLAPKFKFYIPIVVKLVVNKERKIYVLSSAPFNLVFLYDADNLSDPILF